jgi:hypothetical protein
MAIPLSNFLRALFLVMGCLMVGTLVASTQSTSMASHFAETSSPRK